MFLSAGIITSVANSLIIPMSAVLPQPDGTAIAYIIQANNTVKAQSVKLGEILSGEKVEILEGLKIGDKIVVKGAAFLKDKDVVKVKDE
jgi:multidrug efflux pump subunit AcrA (membrane-fusion protein)